MVETKKLKKKINKQYDIIGESPAIKQLKGMIDKVAPTNARVLITGKTEQEKNWLPIGCMKKVIAHPILSWK
jgi:DNA-binding NtrC family response regulator